jgi:two-component system, LytTR family, response regulator
MKALRSLLIDDEPNARARLRFLLEDEEPERVEIIAEAKDGLEAVAAIEKLRPDLIFLDIQMPGLDGFGVLKALSPNFPTPLIIFVTGFHEHALAAFDANAIAYLLKPIEPERLGEMVDRAWRVHHFGEDRTEDARKLHRLTENSSTGFRHIVARKYDRFVLLDPSNILYFYIDNGIVRARTAEDTFWVNYQLGDLEEGLKESSFFRAHRGSLVNLGRVKEIKPAARSTFTLIMDAVPADRIEVSARQARALRAIIPGL